MCHCLELHASLVVASLPRGSFGVVLFRNADVPDPVGAGGGVRAGSRHGNFERPEISLLPFCAVCFGVDARMSVLLLRAALVLLGGVLPLPELRRSLCCCMLRRNRNSFGMLSFFRLSSAPIGVLECATLGPCFVTMLECGFADSTPRRPY